MSTFSSRLKYLRAMDNVSQKDVATFLGMTPNAYQKYEYGTREPNYEILIKIAEYFQVPSDYLLGIGIFSQWEYIMGNIDKLTNIIKTLMGEAFIEDGTANDVAEFHLSSKNEYSNTDTPKPSSKDSFINAMLKIDVIDMIEKLDEKNLMVFLSSIIEKLDTDGDDFKIYWR